MTVLQTGFETCDQSGFHITFTNGWTISVQFGRGHYSSNYDWEGDDPHNRYSAYQSKAPKSRTAEVAAFKDPCKFVELPGGYDVGKRWTPEQVLYLQNKIANLHEGEDPDFSDWNES